MCWRISAVAASNGAGWDALAWHSGLGYEAHWSLGSKAVVTELKPPIPHIMPSIELESDLRKRTDVLKTESFVQPDTAFIRQGDTGIRRAISQTLQNRQQHVIELPSNSLRRCPSATYTVTSTAHRYAARARC